MMAPSESEFLVVQQNEPPAACPKAAGRANPAGCRSMVSLQDRVCAEGMQRPDSVGLHLFSRSFFAEG